MGVISKKTSLLYPITDGIGSTDWMKILDAYGGVNIDAGASVSVVLSSRITAISTGIQYMAHTTKLSKEIEECSKDKIDTNGALFPADVKKIYTTVVVDKKRVIQSDIVEFQNELMEDPNNLGTFLEMNYIQ